MSMFYIPAVVPLKNKTKKTQPPPHQNQPKNQESTTPYPSEMENKIAAERSRRIYVEK